MSGIFIQYTDDMAAKVNDLIIKNRSKQSHEFGMTGGKSQRAKVG